MAHQSLQAPLTCTDEAPLSRVRPRELWFAGGLAFLLCLVTATPYVLGHLAVPPGQRFTDVLVFRYDQNNYFAYANQAASGAWLFHNPMTGEPHRAVFFNLEWLAMGKMAGWSGVSPALAMHVQRCVAILFMCLGVYWLAALGCSSTAVRRLALVAVMTGGGLGWLTQLRSLGIRVEPTYFIDFGAGLFPFFWSLNVSHFLVAQTFVVFALCTFLGAEASGRGRDYVVAGAFFLAAGSCRPYDMLYLILGVVLYGVSTARRTPDAVRRAGLRAIPLLMTAPLLAYDYWLFKLHPVFSWWSDPGSGAPPPLAFALGFGAWTALLPIALYRLSRERLGGASRLLLCCLSAAVSLTYSYRLMHFSFQFVTDVAVPLVMLVAISLAGPLQRWWTRPSLRALLVLFLLLNSLTAVTQITQAVAQVKHGRFRVDGQILEAFAWLRAHSRPRDVVLASSMIANVLPRYTRNSSYCGYYNAVRFGEKARALEAFFDPATPDALRRELVLRSGARFVLLTSDQEKQTFGGGAAPFPAAFRNRSVAIYRLNAPIGPAGGRPRASR